MTLRLEDVPLETAVRLLSEMAGLKPVRVGNTLFVTSKDNAKEMSQDPDIAQPNPARTAEIQQLQQQLQLQLGAQAQLGGIGIPGGAPAALGPITLPNVPPAVPPAVAAPKDDTPAPAPSRPTTSRRTRSSDPRPLTDASLQA